MAVLAMLKSNISISWGDPGMVAINSVMLLLFKAANISSSKYYPMEL